jgi:penicillin-binding protein 2
MSADAEPPAGQTRASDGGAVSPPRETAAHPDADSDPQSAGQTLRDLTPRLRVLQGTVLALLLVLVAGLGYLQLNRADEYTALAKRQTHRRVLTPAPRGVIYDREQRVLADNRIRTDATINLGALRHAFLREEASLRSRRRKPTTTGESVADPAGLAAQARLAVVQSQLDRVNAILGRDTRIDATRLERAFARERFTPFTLVEALTAEEIKRLSAALSEADLVQLRRSHERNYPQGRTGAHVLGRVREERIRTPVTDDFPTMNYTGAVGESGIEKQYESRLQGRPGEKITRIDAFGFAVDSREQQAAAPGSDLTLSLDLDLQRAAEHAMDATPGKYGAAVAISVQTGEILALASKPDFDLNGVSIDLSPTLKRQIDASGGWLNRATQALYPPGSSFKIFTVLAGLRSDTLQPTTSYRCDGFLHVGNRRFVCHHAVRTALARSCNVFAYRTGLAAGPTALAAEARRFHFAEPTGIDLPSETTRMLVPDPSWKTHDNRGPWTDGDTVNLAIGQGFLRISPLQAACAMASLARRETLTVPTLLHQPNRRPAGDRAPEPLALSDADYATLLNAMKAVVETGIGRDAQVPGITIAGKTGTAQILRPEGMQNIAWFLAFAPADDPQIAIAVAMEGAEPNVEFAGAEHAAPIVREILGTYFDKQSRR